MKKFLEEDAVAELMESYGIPVLRLRPVKKAEAPQIAWSLGYPVILKLKLVDSRCSLKFVASEKEMAGAISSAESLNATDNFPEDDVYVQKMPPGKEVSVGFLRNEGYPPVVSLSLGGLFTTILNEVSYANLPVHRDDIKRMTKEIGADSVLENGELAQCINAVLKISLMGMDKKEIIEMDIKLVVHEKIALAVDASIIVG